MSVRTRYDQIVSLGRACQGAHQIRRLTGVSAAHIFDWIITTDRGVVQWIDSDLEGFFARERLEMSPEGVVVDRLNRTQFLHEFPAGCAFDEAYAENVGRYATLAARWRALLKSRQRVLFVRQHGWDNDERATAVRLREAIASAAPDLQFDLLYLTPGPGRDWGEAQIINRHLPQPEPYVWTGDDGAWRQILGEVAQLPERSTSGVHAFICGLHRSGTSPLHEILKSHSLVSGFTNTGRPKDEGQHLQSVIETDGAFGGPGVFAQAPGARLTEVDVGRYAPRLATLRAEWEQNWDAARPIRIEKSPPNLIRSRFLQDAFSDPRFVFIVRHPLAVARATSKWTHLSVEQGLRHWLAAHRIMIDDARHLRRSCCVRYEDLASNVNHALGRVWSLLEAPPLEIDQAAFSDHNPAYLEQGRPMDLSWDERRVLTHFGYSMQAPYVDRERSYGW